MSDTDYKKTKIVSRSELAWGSPSEMEGSSTDGTILYGQQDQAPAPAPAQPKKPGTMILGIPSLDNTRNAVAGWLVIVQGPGKGTSVQVGYGWSSIGRDLTNRIVLNFGDTSITGDKHAKILYDSEARKFKVANDEGLNPTRVNGEAIDSAVVLKNGDLIKIGATLLRFVPFCGADFDWNEPEATGTSGEAKA
ncbi:FHA domain-containing protein [Roseimicrobium gellanilyticum]|uniref:FHA domain-containing protein n=1 Tax=Roseimicrobium gellanilyticum TaxID=748857 RepID=A0A366HI06_9BACT|nr:FHA domain-containing protein [Roseimicrobium gellanilyticum]RBP41239.1 FHA domain-containing protein [Roseimicrobium gellanilyticum]